MYALMSYDVCVSVRWHDAESEEIARVKYLRYSDQFAPRELGYARGRKGSITIWPRVTAGPSFRYHGQTMRLMTQMKETCEAVYMKFQSFDFIPLPYNRICTHSRVYKLSHLFAPVSSTTRFPSTLCSFRPNC